MDDNDSLYAALNLGLLHHVHASLKAHFLYQRDVHYMVRDGEIVIVDEHTGRAMVGRRWSDGIHQAVEAKERVPIRNETQTLASTTPAELFPALRQARRHDWDGRHRSLRVQADLWPRCGDRADPQADDSRRSQRPHLHDEDEKYDAVVEDILEATEAGQPVLVGTASIDSSERLSRELNRRKLKHSVLNAKQHEREAEIVAQAGRAGVITIATNMAGRGTDIVLGGNWQAEIAALGDDPNADAVAALKAAWEERHQAVIDAGGLHIVGTERHESRRIDNQLRGRAGRQGRPRLVALLPVPGKTT